MTLGPFPAAKTAQVLEQELRLCLRLTIATDEVAAAIAALATDEGLYVILAVTVLPAGAPVTGTVGTALYAEISRLRALRKGVAVATARRVERVIVDFIFAVYDFVLGKDCRKGVI